MIPREGVNILDFLKKRDYVSYMDIFVNWPLDHKREEVKEKNEI